MFGLFKKKDTTPLRELTYIGSKDTIAGGIVYGIFIRDTREGGYTQMTMCRNDHWELTVADGGVVTWHNDKEAVTQALDDWIIFNETGKMPDRAMKGVTLEKHPDDEEDNQ